MASKSAQQGDSDKVEVEETLDYVDKTIDRVKTLYEQYFLGIQKQPPTHLHGDIERKFRDLTRVQIRNTGLRYRFATLQQKFGAYNSYWRRTLRQIENGTYIRTLQKLSRRAAQTGEEIPDEILAAMPKRMREQVKRDRAVALAQARRREEAVGDSTDAALELPEMGAQGEASARPDAPAGRGRDGAFRIDAADDADFDVDAFFASVTNESAGSFGDDTQENAAPYAEPAPPARPSAPASVAAAIGVGRASSPALRAPPPTPPRTGAIPRPPLPPSQQTGAIPRPPPLPPSQQTGANPRPPPTPPPTGAIPRQPYPRAATSPGAAPAPSQVTRPNPVRPGVSQAIPAVPVATMAGPFPRAAPPVSATRPVPVVPPPASPPSRPPPGMNDADVNALHAKYVQAKKAVGQDAGPGSFGKLLKTLNAQAPKIMEQYNAKGVEFSVVVKDNQVVLKAKPKT